MTIFDFVKSSVSILDLVSSYVSLKRMGGYYKGPCPLHSEKDASFTVSPDKNIYYCFGCQAGGDVISFIARLERLTQGQAVRHLIDRYSLSLPEGLQKELTNQGEMSSRESLSGVIKVAARLAHQQFMQSEHAQQYLLNRGISKAMMKYFELGLLPGGTTAMQHFVKTMRSQNILLDDLVAAGLMMEGKSNYYSAFEDRILFPIKDQIGRYVGFGGRVFLPNDDRARYYNSKESELFLKRQTLFGFDQARRAAQQTGTMFLVEGNLDVVAMVQMGYENTVATLGTACTLEHLHLLRRFVHTIVLVYDGDKAGQNGIEKIAELCWDLALTLTVVPLPAQDDPASLLEQNISIAPWIEQQEDIFTFLIKKSSKDFFSKPMSEKLLLCNKMIEMINHSTTGVKKHLLLQQVSSSLQIPLAMLQNMSKYQENKKEKSLVVEKPQQKISDEGLSLQSLEDKITGFFFVAKRQESQYLQAYMGMQEYWSDYSKSLVTAWFQSPLENLQRFLDSLPQNDQQLILSLVMQEHETVSYEMLDQLIAEYKKRWWKQEIHRLKEAIVHARNEGDQEKVHLLVNDFLVLKQKIQN